MPAFDALPWPITIGIVSDTHIACGVRALPAALIEGLKACDCIFHAGDACARHVLDQLAELAPVHAVHGNNDEPILVGTLPREQWFVVGQFRIGLLHGHDTGRTAQRAAFKSMYGHVDCAVYGHSHHAEVESRDGLLMVNPGSPTQPRFGRIPTFAIIRVTERIDARIIPIQ